MSKITALKEEAPFCFRQWCLQPHPLFLTEKTPPSLLLHTGQQKKQHSNHHQIFEVRLKSVKRYCKLFQPFVQILSLKLFRSLLFTSSMSPISAILHH